MLDLSLLRHDCEVEDSYKMESKGRRGIFRDDESRLDLVDCKGMLGKKRSCSRGDE